MSRLKASFVGLLVLLAGLCLWAVPTAIAEEEPLPVVKVELFSSGVGYFEHFGKVEGDGSLELRFKTSQVNDVLKSLVLQDLDGGKISTVVYPSKDPLSKILQSFQVDISAEPTFPELLSQLRGAEVAVTSNAEQIDGTILGLEERPKIATEGGEILKVWVLNLVSGGTIRALELENIQSLEIKDSKLKAELAEALQTISDARGADIKQVALNFTGQGERRIRVGYLVETPIWKTSYRLIMPEKDKEEGYLQGWAIVENQTDNDWTGVGLSLVSGRPISFIQDLYQPLYLPRPVVQPELQASLTPQAYERGFEGGVPAELAPSVASAAAPPPPSQAKYLSDAVEAGERKVSYTPIQPTPGETTYCTALPYGAPDGMRGYGGGLAAGMDVASSVAAAGAAGEVGELFRYMVENVSLPRQRSAMIPIVTDPIEVERVSIYNQAVHQKHPLNGARMKNTTGKHLLQGPVTVLDENTYAGDARIGNLPPGQERLLSYAVDMEVSVKSASQRDEAQLQTGKIVKGVLHLTRKRVASQDYLMENESEKDKVVVVEHPLRGGWKLVGTPEPFETTEALYRFRIPIAASVTAELVVNEEITQSESIALLPTDIGRFEFYTRTGEIPAEVREALGQAISLKSAIVNTEREIEQRRGKIAEITAEQERIRSNMKSVQDRTSSYYTRLLKKLDDQETELESLQKEIEGLETQRKQQQGDLEAYLGSLNVG